MNPLVMALRERRAVLKAELSKLTEELGDIDRLLEKHGTSSRPPDCPGRGFKPDPASRASRLLAQARMVLQSEPAHELPFIELYRRMPAELNGGGNKREDARNVFQRYGKRVGIRYRDARHVVLDGTLGAGG